MLSDTPGVFTGRWTLQYIFLVDLLDEQLQGADGNLDIIIEFHLRELVRIELEFYQFCQPAELLPFFFHIRRGALPVLRQLLLEGDMPAATELLGRHHMMAGEVVHGLARGRELGFPTANLELEARGLIPADGVYAGWLVDESGNRHPSAISVGTNPTFDGIEHRQVEAHVIDRPEERVEDFNLYGQRVLIEFVKRLRPMVAYTGVEALIEQINDDVAQTREVLAEDAKNYCPPECPVQAEVKHPQL